MEKENKKSNRIPLHEEMNERFTNFLNDPHRALPPGPLEYFLKKSHEKLGDVSFKKFMSDLERDNFRGIYEVLYAAELSYPLALPHGKKYPGHGFYRGKNDLKDPGNAVSPWEQGKYTRRNEAMDELFGDAIKPENVQNVVEVGGAWGSTMKWIMDTYSPEKYYNFEIDGVYAEWTAKTLGSITMKTDGETLTGIDDASIDLCVCFDVLPWVPPIKIFSYFTEFDRVTRPGGHIGFNVFIGDYLTKEQVRTYLYDSFPRRAYSHIPLSFISTNFPEDQYDFLHTTNQKGTSPEKITFFMRKKG